MADGDGNDDLVTMTGDTNLKMVAGACIARGSPGNLSILDKSNGCLFNTLELSGATCAATAGCENDFYDGGAKVFVIAPQTPNFMLAAYDEATQPPTLSYRPKEAGRRCEQFGTVDAPPASDPTTSNCLRASTLG
jgi:hypothetical protein